MTHHLVRVLEDGTRIYSNYTRYRPMDDGLRKNKRRRPDDKRAVRYYGNWFLPLELLVDSARTMPETRPDTDAVAHAAKPRACKCNVCARPESLVWALVGKGLTP